MDEPIGMTAEQAWSVFEATRLTIEDDIVAVALAAQQALVRVMDARMALEASDLIVAGAYWQEIKRTLGGER